MKFVKLTMKNSDGNNIYLSLDEISGMEQIKDSNDTTKHFYTRIFTKNIDNFAVRETPKEIISMINDDRDILNNIVIFDEWDEKIHGKMYENMKNMTHDERRKVSEQWNIAPRNKKFPNEYSNEGMEKFVGKPVMDDKKNIIGKIMKFEQDGKIHFGLENKK